LSFKHFGLVCQENIDHKMGSEAQMAAAAFVWPVLVLANL
jgi:hypothetical protein